MLKSIGLQLLVLGALLGSLGTLVHRLLPDSTAPTFYACAIGGILCLLCGAQALRGGRFRGLAVATLAPLCFVLLSQVVLVAWPSGASSGVASGRAFALLCLLLALSLGALIRIASASVVRYGGAPSPTPPPPVRSDRN